MKKIYSHSMRMIALLTVLTMNAIAAYAQDAPSIEIEKVSFKLAEGKVGTTTIMGTIHVKAVNLTSETTIDVTGTNRNQFSTSVTTIAAGSSETDIEVRYTPTAIGKHKGNINIDCPSIPEAYTSIKLEGIAIDPANPPTLTVTPTTLPGYKAVAGQTADQTIAVKSANAADYVYLSLKQKQAFRISTTMVYKNIQQNVKVTFAPKEEGEFLDTLVIATYGTDTLLIPLKGVADDGTVPGAKEGDELSLNEANPLALLDEHFDNVKKNKPLKLSGWLNVALEGTRAWWGYDFPDIDESFGEKVAKITPYDSKIELGSEEDCSMMLITPPLDYQNSESKMFTFRVRGDYLKDNQSDFLGLYYLDIQDGEVYSTPIEEVRMPNTGDESGEWLEFHVNMTGLHISDVFFMGFGFASKRGTTNAATYYIDDVTYGRTDIPEIQPSVSELAFVSRISEDYTSNDITVEAKNLTEPIKVKVGGPNKSKFSASVNELPATGGKFNVTFNSDEKGVHSAYVKLSSRGAADMYIALSVNNTTDISATTTADNGTTSVFDLSGKIVATYKNMNIEEVKNTLKPGIYVIKSNADTHTVVIK